MARRGDLKIVAVIAIIGAFAARGDAQCEPQWVYPAPGAGFDGAVYGGRAAFQGRMIVGGGFTHAGATPVNHVAEWTGTTWEPLGSGLSGPATGTGAYALTMHAGTLVVGGWFESAGGAPASNIARWDGRAWSPLGTGVNGAILAFAEYGGGLIVGGYLLEAGGVPARRIARWDGASWHPLGSGLVQTHFTAIEYASALAVYNGELIAGGAFSQAGGVAAHAIARWNGSAWSSLGSGLHYLAIPKALTHVDSLAVYKGALYAGGFFDWADGKSAARIARWDGNSWSALGPGLSFAPSAMVVFENHLIVGAAHVGGIPGQLSRWDERAWAQIPGTVSGGVWSLLSHEGTLWVGGSFTSIAGQSAPNWARWGCACYSDCNNAGGLTIADFGCFQTQFVKGDFYADCNSDNALTIADFGCFQTKFVAGCP